MEIVFDDFLDRVKEVLQNDKLSLPEIAEIIDIKYNTLKFKNSSSLKPEKLILFCINHNINFEWLVYGIGAKYKNQKEIDSNIHKFFEFFGHIGEELNNFQKKIIEFINPDSDGGSAITKDEAKILILVVEALANKLQKLAKLARIRFKFSVELIEEDK